MKIETLLTTLQVSRGQYTGYEVITKNEDGDYLVDADLTMDGNNITDVVEIQFHNVSHKITDDGGAINLDVETDSAVFIRINDTVEYSFARNLMQIHGARITGLDELFGLTETNSLDDTTSGWIYNSPTSHRLAINSVNKLQIAANVTSFEDNPVDMKSISLPNRPDNNVGRLFMRRNSSAKTEFCILFNTGNVIVIAREP